MLADCPPYRIPFQRRESVTEVQIKEGSRLPWPLLCRRLQTTAGVDQDFSPAREADATLPVSQEKLLQVAAVLRSDALGNYPAPQLPHPDGARRVGAGLLQEHDSRISDPVGRRWKGSEPPESPEFSNRAQQTVLCTAAAALKRFAQVLWSRSGGPSAAQAGEADPTECLLPEPLPRPARAELSGGCIVVLSFRSLAVRRLRWRGRRVRWLRRWPGCLGGNGAHRCRQEARRPSRFGFWGQWRNATCKRRNAFAEGAVTG